MNREAFVLNYTKQNAYQSNKYTNLMVRNATPEDDLALTQLFTQILETPLLNLKLQRGSYLDAALLNYTRSDTKVIVAQRKNEQILGMFNIGWKYCFINEKPDVQRYLADIRMHTDAKALEILAVIAEYLEDYLNEDMLFQSVLLKDQLLYQSDLYQNKKNFPHAYRYDDMYCYAVSEVKSPRCSMAYKFKIFNHELVGEVQNFFKKMSQYYNFLPQYDFASLAQKNHPFWVNLVFEDFYLVYEQSQLVGFYGLWDQRPLKQVSIEQYSTWLKYLRPFYNLYAGFSGKMSLPSLHEPLDCLVLHSVLCHPQHLDVFEQILFHAIRQTKRRRQRAFCIGLASNDPRLSKMDQASVHKLAAKHIFHSFELHPRQVFDRQKISFFELGRL